ncbi:aldehyde dehydrogenase family protein [Tundrisphaera sp. TA3]|uniref:aldehyde dehydrogenase family protein n=1 Tax=Tundrisphaera sp. TA3 TaxID=3435775 RepID=UPI003EBB02C2
MRRIEADDALVARNPATGAVLGRASPTDPDDVAGIVERARVAQQDWGRTSHRERREALRRWWRILARDSDAWALAIRDAIGKPSNEAMGEVLAALDAVRWTVLNSGKALADQRIGPGWQRAMLIPPARLRWMPVGVVGMIGTWNYPLYLNAPPIAQAVAAGNAVVWKPSELAAGLGVKLQQSIDEAGFPSGLVAAVHGGPEVGRALVASRIDQGMFTGGVEAGRSIIGELGRRGIPCVAELSGFDPAVVLPDAPLPSTARSLTWAAFVGAGQACVAVKRIYVIGDASPWADALAAGAAALRVGDPTAGNVDLGPMISASARDRFQAMIERAVAAGGRILVGGRPAEGPGWFYPPTVLLASDGGPEAALAGCFGPVVVVRGVPDDEAAVSAVNASPYGLSASVWGRDRGRADRIARRLEAGMVSINDAVTYSAHAAAPFGGLKASGFGRVGGVAGLRGLAQPQVIHARSPGGFRPQLFPYSDRLAGLMTLYRRWFHPSR